MPTATVLARITGATAFFQKPADHSELLYVIRAAWPNAGSLCIKMDSALNRPVDDWGKQLGDSAAVTAMLDRLLHHGHVLKCGPRSWRTKTDLPPQEASE